MVSVKEEKAMRTEKFTLRKRQSLFQNMPAPTTGFRRILRIHLTNSPASTSFFHFVEQKTNEKTPTSIAYTFVKSCILMVFTIPLPQQVLYAECLKANETAFVDQFPACLMQEVTPLISDLPMNLYKPCPCPASLESALFLGGKSSLRIFERLFGFPKPARIVNYCAVRKSGKTIQSEVYTDFFFFSRGQNLQWHTITGKNSIPTFAFAFDSSSFDFAFNFPVLAHFDCAYFREPNLLLFDFDRAIVCLWIGKRVEELYAFKAWKTCSLALVLPAQKEPFERFIQSLNDILENLRIDGFEFGELAADFGQLLDLSICSKRLFARSPNIASLFKSTVIEKSASIEDRKQNLYLCSRRIDSELKGLSHWLFLNAHQKYSIRDSHCQEEFQKEIAAVSPRLKSGVLAAYLL